MDSDKLAVSVRRDFENVVEMIGIGIGVNHVVELKDEFAERVK
jgi:hypothetical protein